jgi:c-di-GMP-binding flagellar brake protein YcgR
MNERRELRRRRLVHSIELYDRASERYLGKGVDVTTRGLLLVTETPISQDTELQLRMTLPETMFGKDQLEFDATARWRSKDVNPGFYDVGLEFTRISPRDQEIIRQVICMFSLVG